MENIYAGDWDEENDREGFRFKEIALLQRLGGELLGGTIYLLPPGQKSFPYHLHFANEELLVMLEGEVVVRAPDGEHQLGRGDTKLFPRGRQGAHQVANRSETDARYIMFSSRVSPDIVEYPDSGNIGLHSHRKDAGDEANLRFTILDGNARRDYYHGE